MENQLTKFAKLIVASRVVARAIIVTRLKMSASAKAPARKSTLAAALRAKTGSKGIIYKRFLRKARPDEDFRYFSKLRARSLSENAI